MDRLLDAREVAALLHVPERWVREHTRSGLVPHVRLGRYVRYRGDAVVAWLAEQEQGGAAWRKHRPRSVARISSSGCASIGPRSLGTKVDSVPPSGGATGQSSPTPGASTEGGGNDA
jgi:excisionase family DNA binding protein